MLTSLRYLSGQFSPLLLLLLALMLTVSCSGPLSLLTGGGPNIAVNVQAGKTNTQTVGTTSNTDQTIKVGSAGSVEQKTTTTKVATDSVQTVIVNEVPTWLILLFGVLCGFLIPSPREIVRDIFNAFKR